MFTSLSLTLYFLCQGSWKGASPLTVHVEWNAGSWWLVQHIEISHAFSCRPEKCQDDLCPLCPLGFSASRERQRMCCVIRHRRLSSRSLEPDGVSFRSLVKGEWRRDRGRTSGVSWAFSWFFPQGQHAEARKASVLERLSVFPVVWSLTSPGTDPITHARVLKHAASVLFFACA